jgi:hypothetical protein
MKERFITNYQKSPGNFWAWFSFLFILGLIGTWIPILYKWVKDIDFTFGNIIISGELSTFSIVALIEGAINIYNNPPSKKKGWPFFYMIISLFFVIMNSLFYYMTLDGTNNCKIKFLTLFSSILSCVLAVFLYGFKTIDLEEDADIVTIEENAIVEKSAQSNNKNPLP